MQKVAFKREHQKLPKVKLKHRSRANYLGQYLGSDPSAIPSHTCFSKKNLVSAAPRVISLVGLITDTSLVRDSKEIKLEN